MDIDNITDLDLLRELAKRNRTKCINDYFVDGMHFVKGYWYLGSAHYSGGLIIWLNNNVPHYSKHIVLKLDEAMKYFDIGL